MITHRKTATLHKKIWAKSVDKHICVRKGRYCVWSIPNQSNNSIQQNLSSIYELGDTIYQKYIISKLSSYRDSKDLKNNKTTMEQKAICSNDPSTYIWGILLLETKAAQKCSFLALYRACFEQEDSRLLGLPCLVPCPVSLPRVKGMTLRVINVFVSCSRKILFVFDTVSCWLQQEQLHGIQY